jgi:hypothetical protein
MKHSAVRCLKRKNTMTNDRKSVKQFAGSNPHGRVSPDAPLNPTPAELLASTRFIPTEPPDPNEPRVDKRVIRGVVDAPTDIRRRAGYDHETKEYTHRLVPRRFGPGEIVSLPASEAQRLERLGFLQDPELTFEPRQDEEIFREVL